MKVLSFLLAACLTLAPLRAAGPEFEVASIRPAPDLTPELMQSGKLHVGMSIDHGRVDIGGIPLNAILQAAFRTRQGQISGPDWMSSTRFDILAKLPDGASEDQVPEMLQALLADRFKLTVHRETKDQPAYALVIAKGGIKAKEIPADAEVPSLLPPSDSSGAPLQTQVAPLGGSLMRITQTPGGGGVISGPKMPGIRIQPQQGGRGGGTQGLHLEAPKITFTELATLLSEMVNRQVVDMTETKSSYQISLDISFEELMAEAQARAQAGPGQPPMPAAELSNPMAGAVVAAVQKLGLRLDSRKVPTEMIVVDHIEKTPSAN